MLWESCFCVQTLQDDKNIFKSNCSNHTSIVHNTAKYAYLRSDVEIETVISTIYGQLSEPSKRGLK
jgi:hypothetical protein